MGFNLAIASNCRRRYWQSIFNYFNLEPLFKRVLCIEDYPAGGKAYIVSKLLEEFKPDRAFLIGDTLKDWEAAQSNGLPFIACLWGYGKEEDLKALSPFAVVKEFPQIGQVLNIVK